MYKLKFSTIIKQFKADLIGKDSHRGVTLTYSWLANQFGHFAIGYILTIIIFQFLPIYTKRLFHAQLIVCGIVTLFELYNFLGPLLIKKEHKNIFKPAWSNIAFDTITDVLFFTLGAFSISLLFPHNSYGKKLVILVAVFLTYPIYYWFKTKIILQNAGYPIQIRLSQWQGVLSIEFDKTILDFIQQIQNGNKGYHLILNGSDKPNFSRLGIGIATELSIKNYSCKYITYTKLNSQDENLNNSSDLLWDINNSELLVIDDICIQTENEMQFLSKYLSQSVIWIIYNDKSYELLKTFLRIKVGEKNKLKIIN